MPRAFLSTSSLSVSLKKKMTRKANSKDALAPLGLLYDDCSHRLLLLLVFDMVINQKNSNSRRDGMRLKRNILVRSTFLLQLFATLRRERKQQRRNKCCCCISTLAGAFEFLSLSPHSRPNELRGVLLTARNILLLSVPRQLFANVPNINGRKELTTNPKTEKKKKTSRLVGVELVAVRVISCRTR